MPKSENEKKGIVYEAFVKLAVQKALHITLLWERDIPGVIANQDFVYPDPAHPEMVFAVTHWGSHEAANKKFWRTVEDRFEVYNAFPEASFFSVVFEKNYNSDDALDEQLRILCFGKNISERNSPAIIALQRFVDTDEKVRSFGNGKDIVYFACEQLYEHDSGFKESIDALGDQISQMRSDPADNYIRAQDMMEHERTLSGLRNGRLVHGALKETYYKMAIIKLLRFSDEAIRGIVDTVNNHSWNELDDEIVAQLVGLKLVKFVGIARRAAVDPILKSIAEIGADGYIEIRKQLSELIFDPGSPYSAYRDHYLDITNEELRQQRYNYLVNCDSYEELLEVEHGIPPTIMDRAWVLDYYLALKRKNSPHGEYGFQKLSNELRIQYTAGGVVSPLPRYAAGNEPNITGEEKQRLYQHIWNDMRTFDHTLTSDVTIVDDRNVTLMKKLDVIGVLIANAVNRLRRFGCEIFPAYRIYSPLSRGTTSAAATDYNFLIKKDQKAVLIFVVSAYDASHKHKELSGRLRFGKASGGYPNGSTKNIIVFDGTMFSSQPERKLQMLYNSGWDHLYYVDELDAMCAMIEQFLNS